MECAIKYFLNKEMKKEYLEAQIEEIVKQEAETMMEEIDVAYIYDHAPKEIENAIVEIIDKIKISTLLSQLDEKMVINIQDWLEDSVKKSEKLR